MSDEFIQYPEQDVQDKTRSPDQVRRHYINAVLDRSDESVNVSKALQFAYPYMKGIDIENTPMDELLKAAYDIVVDKKNEAEKMGLDSEKMKESLTSAYKGANQSTTNAELMKLRYAKGDNEYWIPESGLPVDENLQRSGVVKNPWLLGTDSATGGPIVNIDSAVAARKARPFKTTYSELPLGEREKNMQKFAESTPGTQMAAALGLPGFSALDYMHSEGVGMKDLSALGWGKAALGTVGQVASYPTVAVPFAGPALAGGLAGASDWVLSPEVNYKANEPGSADNSSARNRTVEVARQIGYPALMGGAFGFLGPQVSKGISTGAGKVAKWIGGKKGAQKASDESKAALAKLKADKSEAAIALEQAKAPIVAGKKAWLEGAEAVDPDVQAAIAARSKALEEMKLGKPWLDFGEREGDIDLTAMEVARNKAEKEALAAKKYYSGTGKPENFSPENPAKNSPMVVEKRRMDKAMPDTLALKAAIAEKQAMIDRLVKENEAASRENSLARQEIDFNLKHGKTEPGSRYVKDKQADINERAMGKSANTYGKDKFVLNKENDIYVPEEGERLPGITDWRNSVEGDKKELERGRALAKDYGKKNRSWILADKDAERAAKKAETDYERALREKDNIGKEREAYERGVAKSYDPAEREARAQFKNTKAKQMWTSHLEELTAEQRKRLEAAEEAYKKAKHSGKKETDEEKFPVLKSALIGSLNASGASKNSKYPSEKKEETSNANASKFGINPMRWLTVDPMVAKEMGWIR